MRASESPLQSYKSKRILSFADLICSSVPGPKAKTCLCFAILSYSEKLWNVFEIVLAKCEVFVQKSLSLKKYSERKNSQTLFVVCVNLPTVKIWGQSDKFPMSFSPLQWLLHVKKLIRENSAKYVNPTFNFYFRPKLKIAIPLPIFNLFQWSLFFTLEIHLDHYFNRRIEIWRKLPIWRYTVTLNCWDTGLKNCTVIFSVLKP